MEEGLHLIAQRMKDPVIAGEVTWRRFPGVWGLERLPVRFTPVAPEAPATEALAAH